MSLKEEWKPIKNFEGLYEVSNLGRVKSLGRTIQRFNGSCYVTVTYPPKFLKRTREEGYAQIKLSKNGKTNYFMLHRLVAEAFIENPNNKPEVNHKDGDKQNCCASNLCWCTKSENVQHAYDTGLHKTKKVKQYTRHGVYIKTWDSIKEAQEKLSIWNISECCKGNRKSSGGYIWRCC